MDKFILYDAVRFSEIDSRFEKTLDFVRQTKLMAQAILSSLICNLSRLHIGDDWKCVINDGTRWAREYRGLQQEQTTME